LDVSVPFHQIIIQDLTGKVVWSETYESFTNHAKIDISKLSNGVYTATALDKYGKKVIKFIKH
ncbi:MAG: T9SS type A sorting domain-containing protein, partial [Crocinitomicaceae bacterium]|nr:T9SS type A sorting domain-containing protein [Crocinitomicaceae bacterium]